METAKTFVKLNRFSVKCQYIHLTVVQAYDGKKDDKCPRLNFFNNMYKKIKYSTFQFDKAPLRCEALVLSLALMTMTPRSVAVSRMLYR